METYRSVPVPHTLTASGVSTSVEPRSYAGRGSYNSCAVAVSYAPLRGPVLYADGEQRSWAIRPTSLNKRA